MWNRQLAMGKSLNLKLVTRNPQPKTCNLQLVTGNPPCFALCLLRCILQAAIREPENNRYLFMNLTATTHLLPYMKRILFILLVITVPVYFLQAQPKIKNKKYPSLFWEITGPGLKKPSYLFGTMHVSSKLVFNLSDSFYTGIRNADVVALENNPETWQEDIVNYDMKGYGNDMFSSGSDDYENQPNEYLYISTLKYYPFEKMIEAALSHRSGTINSLLYRSFSDFNSDFEENTFLDMYIFQCGKKSGKKISGVENYRESMRLMLEAYMDQSKEKNKKVQSYEYDENFGPNNLQDAYRSGDLDLLDSINKRNSQSAAFDEKFLYRRNEIQADNMDSIIKSGKVLFVGVGAAHLPGQRGVIELLRKKGYKLRPIMMNNRDSKQKDIIEKIRVPVSFSTQTAADSFYKVDVPGKLYNFESRSNGVVQFADMANGSYYSVIRIPTNSNLLGHDAKAVYKKIDSLLYENVPGKIIIKQEIMRNGYRGIDLTNRTRRGDLQRYNIFLTPFEVLIFKISGTGDYIRAGEEAKRFFGSIQLKEATGGDVYKKFEPASGGFGVNLPHEPFKGNKIKYEAEDKSKGIYYSILRNDIHNYSFAEEDSFDLSLLEESFGSNEFIEKQISRKQTTHKGYPALETQYLHKDGSVITAKFIIQGPHYYTLIAKTKNTKADTKPFFNSFEITPFKYKTAENKKDTSLYYSVKTPVYPEPAKNALNLPSNLLMDIYRKSRNDEDSLSEKELLQSSVFRTKIIKNDTTGEKIYISFHTTAEYSVVADSTKWKKDDEDWNKDSAWIVRYLDKKIRPDKTTVYETIVTDSNSTRTIRTKSFYKDGISYTLMTQGDTLTAPSAFVKNFFETFTPDTTLKGINLYTKKTPLFFADYFSTDTALRKKAIRNMGEVSFDAGDLANIKKAIRQLTWKDKKYLELKTGFINELGAINTKESTDYLKELYKAAADTIELSNAILENLLAHQTKYAYTIFKDIVIAEPPVLSLGESTTRSTRTFPVTAAVNYDYEEDYSDGESIGGGFLDALSDSLLLTKTIFPDLLPLINLDDYKWPMMNLMAMMADSSLISPKEYALYSEKFLLEAKQELRKQALAEKKKAIAIATAKDEEEKETYGYDVKDNEDAGNESLSLYARLLMPFYETNAGVKEVMNKMIASNDKKLKYNTLFLLLRNKKPVSDTLFTYFAGMEDYRYDLYSDLKELKMQSKFPAKYNTHLLLGKSRLMKLNGFEKPDTMIFAERLETTYKKKTGYIYFFKYKKKKDDISWKVATLGLLPTDTLQFEFDKPEDKTTLPSYSNYSRYGPYDFSELSNEKINEDEPETEQFRKILKKMIYAKRASAAMFYEERNRYGNYSPMMTEPVED
jgi:uncharacterized protein YbaP (TraB family)